MKNKNNLHLRGSFCHNCKLTQSFLLARATCVRDGSLPDAQGNVKGLAATLHRCLSAAVHPMWPSLFIPLLFPRSHIPWRRVLPLLASAVSTLCGYSTIIYPELKSKKRPEKHEACWSLVYVAARSLNLDLIPWCYLCCFCHCVVFYMFHRVFT